MTATVTPYEMTVHLAGDSTVSAFPAIELPMSGWGAHLAAPLNHLLTTARGPAAPLVHVVNGARPGATTASLRDDGIWEALLAGVAPGDVVVLQFGHNDQKLPELAAHGAFRAHLTAFVDDVHLRRARAVLCTPVVRRRFGDDGRTIAPSLGEYPAAVRMLARDADLPLIDLTLATAALLEDLGRDGSTVLFTHRPVGDPLYPDGIVDDTHFSTWGAQRVATLVARELLMHLA